MLHSSDTFQILKNPTFPTTGDGRSQTTMNRESGLASYWLAPVKNKTFPVEWSNHLPARVGYYYQILFKCNRVNKKNLQNVYNWFSGSGS
jgi:hypothetical protein